MEKHIYGVRNGNKWVWTPYEVGLVDHDGIVLWLASCSKYGIYVYGATKEDVTVVCQAQIAQMV